jgi:hypothetical protein
VRSSEWERLRPLAVPVYVVAALLIAIPLADTILSVMPPRPGDVAWRFGALGLGGQAVLTPLLGALLALVTAAVFGHRRTLRAVQIVAALAALVFVAASGIFALDALQTRPSIQAAAKGAVDRASIGALAKYAIGCAALVVFAIASHRLLRRNRAESAADAEQPQLVSSSRAGS